MVKLLRGESTLRKFELQQLWNTLLNTKCLFVIEKNTLQEKGKEKLKNWELGAGVWPVCTAWLLHLNVGIGPEAFGKSLASLQVVGNFT